MTTAIIRNNGAAGEYGLIAVVSESERHILFYVGRSRANVSAVLSHESVRFGCLFLVFVSPSSSFPYARLKNGNTNRLSHKSNEKHQARTSNV